MTARSVFARIGIAFVAAIALAAALVAWLNRDPVETAAAPATAGDAATLVARGEYLVRAGSCLGCHTESGGPPYAGGRAIETPFGNVYGPNLTPDVATGLGAWTDDDFWRALHHGKARDGRLLYPAFPYPNYTRLERADADAMFAYLRSVSPVAKANRPHALDFPFDQPAALAVWRALFFRPGQFEPDPARTASWNRGAYLVETLGHCNACHSQRNVFGATTSPLDLAGGLIPIQNWYAPSLRDDAEAGVGAWPVDQIVALLKNGVARHASVQGPMAEVVVRSTSHLNDADVAAMAEYLRSLPDTTPANAPARNIGGAGSERGAELYKTHCADCHGADGAGVPGAYPALANSRAVVMSPPANLVHIVLRGGFAPTTAGNPRPFGMPPFATVLSNGDVAEILTHIRNAWGQQASAVSALEVSRYRGAAR